MKKISIVMATAFASVVGLSSCTSAPTASLKTDLDSLSYAFAMAQGGQLEQYYAQVGIGANEISEFRKGLLEGINGKEPATPKERAYAAGKEIGLMVANRWVKGLNQQLFGQDTIIEVSKDNIIAGFLAAVDKDSTFMDPDAASTYYQAAAQAISMQKLREKSKDYIAENEKWLADNKGKDSIQVQEVTIYDPIKKDSVKTEFQYKILKAGKGAIPTATDRVKVNYEGKLIDGTVFDSSYQRNQPTTFGVSQVIKGWTEALKMMPEGSIWEVYIPENLAYGAQQQGSIKPFSTLVFKVDLLEIEKPASKK